MFGTLHWNSHTKEAEFVERPHGSSNPETNSACDRCRAKKVKCSTNYGGCKRCKRFGKTCTFSSTKHGGDPGLRKANTSIALQEHPLDSLMQSSSSSSSRDRVHEEGMRSDTRNLASSLPADGSVDDSERGQLLAEHPADGLADLPPDFALSSLTEFGQRNSDQGGDNIFSLSPSPSPFFSAILPSTPEPIQPAAVRMPGNLPSPSLSRYLPSTRHSPEPSLFEIGSNATSASMHTYAIASTAFSTQNLSGKSCQCLTAVVFAVEEFEASCNSGNRAGLDSIIAYQKEAIKCCRSMLKCSNCMTKRENLVLLVFITEKIVAACGQIVVLYHTRDGDMLAGSAPTSFLGYLSTDYFSNHINVEDWDLATSASSSSSKTNCTQSSTFISAVAGASSHWRELLLGDYEVSSPLEWEHLVRVLILLQIRAVMKLLADMKNMGGKILGETQMASLVQAEFRLGELERHIQLR